MRRPPACWSLGGDWRPLGVASASGLLVSWCWSLGVGLLACWSLGVASAAGLLVLFLHASHQSHLSGGSGLWAHAPSLTDASDVGFYLVVSPHTQALFCPSCTRSLTSFWCALDVRVTIFSHWSCHVALLAIGMYGCCSAIDRRTDEGRQPTMYNAPLFLCLSLALCPLAT